MERIFIYNDTILCNRREIERILYKSFALMKREAGKGQKGWDAEEER